jgi:hypothetical protein
MRSVHKRIYSFNGILPHVQIEQIDVADVVVRIRIKSTSGELWFGDPQYTAMDLGIANFGQGI